MPGHSDHGHSHGGCDGDEGHDDTPEMGLQYSLYSKIDTLNLECLNESVEGSGKDVFNLGKKDLILRRFTGNVKLKGVIVVGGEGPSHPSKMRLYKNRVKMTFDDTSLPADQEFELHHDTNGTLEYSTMVVKFATVHHLSIHFPRNFGSETTKVYYIGLRGEFTQAQRQGVVICSYEAMPSVKDHKIDNINKVNYEVQ